MFTHDTRALHLKLELWLCIFMMLLISGCSGCGGCGGLKREGPAFPAQNSCIAAAAAKDIGRGVSFNEYYRDLSADLTFSSDSCVSAQATQGSDLFYKAIVPPNYQLSVSLNRFSDAQLSLYIFTDCADAAGTCIAGSAWSEDNPSPSALYLNTTESSQTFIIGIDSTNSEGGVDGSIEISEIECIPGERRCNEEGEAIERCNQYATYERYACDGACTDGRCETPSGDSCLDAIALEGASGSITGDWSSGTNHFQPASNNAGQCYIDRSSTPSGFDDFYSVALQKGESLSATLTTESLAASMFIVEDCLDPATCAQTNPSLGATTLQYYAQQARTVYVIVDHKRTETEDSYSLDWTISPGDACVPNQTRCADANTATLCNPDGSAEASYRCALGCSYGGCKSTPAEHDSCTSVEASAQDVGQGISVIIDTTLLKDDLNQELDCAGQRKSPGQDLFYKVILSPDEIVEVNVQNKYISFSPDVLIYAFTECAAVNDTCVASGWQTKDSDAAQLRYQNQTGSTQTLIIAIDGLRSGAADLLQAQINKRQPECEPGASRCAPDNVTLLSCDAQRRYVRYACDGACNDGRCERPRGEVCFDAIALEGAEGSINGDWSTTALSKQLNNPPMCEAGKRWYPFYSADFYRVDLKEGELLRMSMDSTTTSGTLVALESCADPLTCAKNNPIGGSTRLLYYATQAQTVYVRAESDEIGEHSYTINWEISTGYACAPGQTRCINATTAARCSPDGSAEAELLCEHGCEIAGCTPELAQDSCATVAAAAPLVTGSLTAYVDLRDFTPTLSIPSSSPCAQGLTVRGEDVFYKVQLSADERLSARLRAHQDTSSSLIYALTDCANAEDSCIANDRASSQNAARFDYVNTTGSTQTFILGVALWIKDRAGFIQVELDISGPQCTPGAVACSANGASLERCTAQGLIEAVLCEGGCADGACLNPTGDVCTDAVALNPGGTVGMQRYTDTVLKAHNLTPTRVYGLSCLNSISGPNGPDKTYTVILAPGQRLEATMTSEEKAFLYMLDSCDSPLSCVAPSADDLPAGEGEPARVIYLNDTGLTQTLYLVAHFRSDFKKDGYTLAVDIQ